MTAVPNSSDLLARWLRIALVAAAVGGALCGLAALLDLEQFLRSYLVGFLFWWAVNVGCLGLLMLYYLVGGRWGEAIRPMLESGRALVPLTAVLFLPLAFGLHYVYPWTEPGVVTEQKAMYLNPTFFYARAAGYFVSWLLLAWIVRPPRKPLTTEQASTRGLRSAGGLALLILTVTFASIDWGMSIDPAWFSSIYGALAAIGGALAALALTTLTVALLEMNRTRTETPPPTYGDLGSLLLAFLMLWAYFSFSQFLIIYSGNLPEENFWYVDRLNGGWQWVGLALVLLHFFLPFFLLLSRDWKQSPVRLAQIAGLLLVMQQVYFFYAIAPSFSPGRLYVHWADLAAPAAVGAVWVSAYLWQVRRRLSQLSATEQS
ncbi:hypothetical protein [Lignipirellula cremea]|uniref:Quinol:cytochrome c oxidoreductase quinone-binding subunit 2 n=1 Tax=Lignipirellula cremea TaxID=2528010 RepID=A0A518E1X9_9BACT|nr:hypothetical protein [Lignipirellula cremea]QDU98095.1 hypothetical protein Pla8534_59560 [Lignipirellula cremea]